MKTPVLAHTNTEGGRDGGKEREREGGREGGRKRRRETVSG